MNYTIKKIPKAQIEILVSLSKDEFDVFLKTAVVDAVKEAHIEGFRPGKAPHAMVKERVGEERIQALAMELAIQKYYEEIVAKEKLDIIEKPNVQAIKHEPNISFTLRATVFPEITLPPDYGAIAKKTLQEKKEIFVDKKEIDESVQWLRESRAKIITVPRTAQKDDRVEIDFVVKDNGVIIEGGKSENHPLIVGSGKFVAGFEDQLLGMKAGEIKNFQLVMPKERANGFGGKKMDFSVTMKLVQERKLPELTNDFSIGVGNFKSVEEMKLSISDGLKKEKEEKERQRIDMAIAHQIAEKSKVEVPDVLIDSELNKMMREFEDNLKNMGMEIGKYLEHSKKTEEDLKKEWRTDAERRVVIALALRAIATIEHIEPSEEDIEAHMNKNLDMFRAEGHNVEKIDKNALADYSRSVLRNKKVFEFLEKQS
ncbi:MAG: trigger factor [Patescibacteria group bacterium]